MGYAQAVEKAWADVAPLAGAERYSVKFLSDTYDIDPASKRALSVSCNVSAKDHVTVILLHYLAGKLSPAGLPPLSGEWVDFNELPGGEGYYSAFKKRTIDHVISKYGRSPEALLTAAERIGGHKELFGDVSAVIHPFAETAILLKMSKADDEFAPDANILFDKNITRIFCTEDIVVLTEFIVRQL